ncbi:hypothetical protein V5E97_25790 [Singulisphaera sp. Ch08]|uniref:Uncharacterized protein n=1 Tax=Singulisphaera sp. Ch08 TaxID=3120278 RepID=A0AAU7C8Z6_9BACT
MERFRVKVKRGVRTFLWGGSDIKSDVTRRLTIPVLLSLRVDDFGENMRFGFLSYEDEGADENEFGTLKPGESFTVTLDGLRAIWAEAEHDCFVDCDLTVPLSRDLGLRSPGLDRTGRG